MNPTINRAGSPPAELMNAIAEAIRSVSARAQEASISPSSLLLEDLALDSLDMVAVVIRIQDDFQVEIDPDEIRTLRTVGDLAASLNRHVRSAA
jgi:acyl carrier protein